MEKTSIIQVKIELVREDGGFQAASLHAIDACFDEGFILKGTTSPAVKIIRLLHKEPIPYFLVGTSNPAEITSAIKAGIGSGQRSLELPYTIFDPSTLTWAEAKSVLQRCALPKLHEIMSSVEKKQYLTVLPKGKSLDTGAAHVFARSLPTYNRPPGVSKYQYFKFLINF